MGILGRNVVMGFGDVLITGETKDLSKDQTAKIRFFQLDSPLMPEKENIDPSVEPVTIILDHQGLEVLHQMTGEILDHFYMVQENIQHAKNQGSLQTENM